MNDGIIERMPALLSLGLSVALYQLGAYGFLMSLAFCLVGASAILVALSLGPRLHTRGGRTGWWGLLVIGTAFFISGVFPPVQTPVIGSLHGISALVVIFGSPIAFTFIDRSLARSEPQLLLPNRLRWATLLAWGGMGLFLVSLIVISLTGEMKRPLIFQYFEEVAGANANAAIEDPGDRRLATAFQAGAFQPQSVWIEAEDTDYEAYKVIKTVLALASDWLAKVARTLHGR